MKKKKHTIIFFSYFPPQNNFDKVNQLFLMSKSEIAL